MALTDIWFLLIAVLWTGYFVLEGFDFGIGMLLRVLGRDNTDRRVLINTIGPVWDGNEVWLLVAGGATFAAFPLWYASLFSGFYLALLHTAEPLRSVGWPDHAVGVRLPRRGVRRAEDRGRGPCARQGADVAA